MNSLKVVLEKKTQISKDLWEFTFTFANHFQFEFKAGQYIWLIFAELKYPDSKGSRRAFSITSPEIQKNKISIITRMTESGYKKTLFETEIGSSLEVIGPFGSSYLLQKDFMYNTVMLAKGSGVAPFLSILRSYMPSTPQSNLKLFYYDDDLQSALIQELSELCQKNKIEFHFSNQPFAQATLVNLNYTADHFYICGSQQFIDQVYPVLESLQVTFEQMYFEQHYPSNPNSLSEADFAVQPGQKNIMLQAINDSKNHVVITDVNGKIIFANRRAQISTGFSFAEMQGNTPRLWGGLMDARLYQAFWKQKKTNSGFDGEFTNHRKNGEDYYVIAHISPIFDDSQNITGYIGIEEDITERIKLEKALIEEKAATELEKNKMEKMIECLGEGVLAVDQQGVVLMLNAKALELLEVEKSEIIGKKYTDVISAEDEQGNNIPIEERPLIKSLYSRKPVKQILIYTKKDQTKYKVEAINSPLEFDGRFYGNIIILRDLSK